MSISTELIRMAQNVGALNADTNAIFDALRAKGVDVPANAQLSDVADMIDSIELHLPTVNIGGRDYPYVQIGNYLWLAENLDWKWNGLNIGSSSSSTTDLYANYFNNEEDIYGWNGLKRGLLYNYPCAAYLNSNANILPSGWRVPLKGDIEKLLDTVGGSNIAGLKLKSQTGWLSYGGKDGNGTDDYGFDFKPTGFCRTDGSFNEFGWDGYFWSTTENDTLSSASVFDIYDSTRITEYDKKLKFAIRLVKDAPGYVTIGGRQYKTVTIGNQEWLAENLDYKFSYNGSTLPIGSSGNPITPAAWYYDNNETSYGIDGTYKCGLLYNWYAAKYLEDNKATLLPNGWHVPTSNDWNTLLTEVGDISTAGTKLKALNNSVNGSWPTGWNGTDDYGFNGIPSGDRYDSIYYDINSSCTYWTSTEYDANMMNLVALKYAEVLLLHDNKYHGFSLRLVRTVA